MAYYEESLYLDQTKELYNIKYESLLTEPEQNSEQDHANQENGNKKSEPKKKHKLDFSTNAYMFFKEKEYIKEDV